MSEAAVGSSTHLRLAERLYRSLANGDLETLERILADDFVGDLSPGLPEGLGASRHENRVAMLRCWGRIAERIDVAPVVEELYATDLTIIGRGRYVGRTRGTGERFDARFAHFWSVRDGRLTSVHQVTDTAAWRDAWTPQPPTRSDSRLPRGGHL